jgi:hypothetical protein
LCHVWNVISVSSAFSYGEPFVAEFYGYIAQNAVRSHKVHYYFPSLIDEAHKKLMERVWVYWVGVQNVLEND